MYTAPNRAHDEPLYYAVMGAELIPELRGDPGLDVVRVNRYALGKGASHERLRNEWKTSLGE